MFVKNGAKKLSFDAAGFINLIITLVIVTASVVAFHYKTTGKYDTIIALHEHRITQIENTIQSGP